MEKTGCKIICGAPTTLAVEGLMMIKKMMINVANVVLSLYFDVGYFDDRNPINIPWKLSIAHGTPAGKVSSRPKSWTQRLLPQS